MVACRYGISLLAFNVLSHSFAALTCNNIELNTRSYSQSDEGTHFQLTLIRHVPRMLWFQGHNLSLVSMWSSRSSQSAKSFQKYFEATGAIFSFHIIASIVLGGETAHVGSGSDNIILSKVLKQNGGR